MATSDRRMTSCGHPRDGLQGLLNGKGLHHALTFYPDHSMGADHPQLDLVGVVEA